MTLRLASLPADCETILGQFADALQAGFDESGSGLSVPERRYLNPGSLVAWDEPQLTIAVIRIYMGEPGAQVTTSVLASQVHQSVSLGILYVDQVPGLQADGSFPPTDALDSAGVSLVSLIPTFWRAAVSLRESGILYEGGSCALGPLTTVGPEGFLAGLSVQVDASVM